MRNNLALKNVFSLSILQFFNYILPLFSVPYLLYKLGAEANGYLITSQTIISYFALLIDYGFVLTAAKKVALTNDKQEISEIFSKVLICKIILFVCTIIIFSLISFLIGNELITLSLLIGFFQVIGFLLNPVWLFQGTENAHMLTKINIIVRSIFYLFIFIFIDSSKDLLLAVFLLSFPYFIVGFWSFLKAVRYFKIKLVKVTFIQIKKELHEGFYGFWITLLNFSYSAVGILLLGIFSNQQIVGIYGTLEKLIRAGIQVFNPIIHGLYPKIINLLKDRAIRIIIKILFLCCCLSIIIGIALSIFSPYISLILLGDLSSMLSIKLLRLLSIWFTLNTINVVVGIWIFFGLDKMKSYSKLYLFATITCFILHLIFIPIIGVVAIPINLIIGEVLLTIFFYFSLRRGII